MERVARSNRATILVADDNDANRELLFDMLSDQGYRVVCAADGEEALRAVHQEPVDVALLDVMMPGKTGYEVCKAIKSQPETRLIPVVLITGLSTFDERLQGIKAGANDFLSKPFNSLELMARVHSLLQLKEFTDELENAETVLFSLALSIEAKDPYTRGHCDRLSEYSMALAKRLGLSYEDCMALRRAGTVHDIGKIAVPEHILLKAGPLTPEEWAVMKEHPATGERICSPLKAFRPVLPIIRHHHEKLDGTGYPDGLRGKEIPLTARVLQIVDVYDALATDRPYRKAMTPERAIAMIREEVDRGWWEKFLVDEFESLLVEELIPGSQELALGH